MSSQLCCGTTRISYGPLRREERGPPGARRWKTSRKVYHVRGVDRFWHWEDQTDHLVTRSLT